MNQLGPGKFDIIVPSQSILAEPAVSVVDQVVDQVVDKRGTRKLAEAYLQFLYSPQGQDLAARHFFRPRDRAVAAQYSARFPSLKLVTIDAAFGGWTRAQATHFADGGTFDRIYSP